MNTVLGTAGNTLSLMTFISVLFEPKDMQKITAKSSFIKHHHSNYHILFCTTAVPKPLSLLLSAFQRKQKKFSAFVVLMISVINFDRHNNKNQTF